MFCPKCATQNAEGAHFCRACGANISLVPQALAGQLPARVDEDNSRKGRRRKRRDRPPSLSDGIQNLMTGFGFVAVALALAFFGRSIGAQVWWFWLLFPAFGMIGKGVAEVVRARELEKSNAGQKLPYAPPRESLPASRTSELRVPVASVTEGTTRHLGTEAPTQHPDSWEDQKPS